MTGTDGELVEVRLLDLPVQIWAAAQEHTDGLLREFALLQAGDEAAHHDGHPAGHDVPARLVRLVDAVQQRYASASEEQRNALFAAAAEGRTRIDLTYRVPPAVKAAVADLDRMLDEADQYCRAGEHLLTLATPPDQLAFRKWYFGEFVAQVDGAAPTPWRDLADR
jgi:hypothetical protein